MTPFPYSLCQKPVVGLIMFVANACGSPPLFQNAPLPLQRAATSVVREADVPVAKPYFLMMDFDFPSAGAVAGDEVVGSRYDENCGQGHMAPTPAQAVGLGRPIPIHVLIRQQPAGTLIVDRVFNTLCLTSSGRSQANGFRKTRTAARLDLQQGKYIIEIKNIADQAGLENVTTSVSLVAGRGK